MKFLRLEFLATLAIVVALCRPALADDDMGDMDGGGGDGGGMENAGGDWGIGGMISDAINSFGNDPGGYYDPGYENGNYYDPGYQSYPSNDGSPYDPGYQSYPSYPAYSGNSGSYAPANDGSSSLPHHAPPPANRLPPHSSTCTLTSTSKPLANLLPKEKIPSHGDIPEYVMREPTCGLMDEPTEPPVEHARAQAPCAVCRTRTPVRAGRARGRATRIPV